MPKELHARPTCAVCRVPVESFTEEEGDGTLRGFVLFVARCHGEVERQKIPRNLTRGLSFNQAFADDTRLPPVDDGKLLCGPHPLDQGTFSNLADRALSADGILEAMKRLREALEPKPIPPRKWFYMDGV